MNLPKLQALAAPLSAPIPSALGVVCQNCKFARKNPKRLDGLDRELVCTKLQDVLSLWFAPQVPDYFGCNLYESKEATKVEP